jgi:hypothetical protein
MRVPNLISYAVLGAALVGCTMDNPAFDEVRDAVGGTAEGDGDSGDGDGDGDPSTGDGDGDPSTGDGDGDGDGEPSTGDGDGDGEPSTGDGDGDGDGDTQSCMEGQQLCNGICVDLKFDNDNCGECGWACPFEQVCAEAGCHPKKYVFVSSFLFHGNFGGPSYANSACNDLAGNAGLPGSYFAWVSTLQQAPAMIAVVDDGAYLLPNGPLVASSWDNLLGEQHLGPINRNEFGAMIEPSPACGLQYAVWTGTTDAGQPTDPNCGQWTTTNNLTTGRAGNPQLTGPGWSESACAASCGLQLPVYCVQQ